MRRGAFTLSVSVLFCLVSFSLATDCQLTKNFKRDDLISAFRGAYKETYGDSRGHNLKREGERVWDDLDFIKMSNRGDNCEERNEYSEDLCRTCVNQLGRNTDNGLFSGRQSKRVFIRHFVDRLCDFEGVCKRSRPSPSPIPIGPFTAIYSSNDQVSNIVSYRFGIVVEDFSTRVVYAVTDLNPSTQFWPFHGIFLEYATTSLDVAFFECASGMLNSKPDVADLAAAAIRDTCYDPSGRNFHSGCADWRLGREICRSLTEFGCIPQGDPLISQC